MSKLITNLIIVVLFFIITTTGTNHMTNSTMNTNSTTQMVIDMLTNNEVNRSSIASIITADLFHQGLSPIASLKVSTAFMSCVEYIDDQDLFDEFFIEALQGVVVEIKDYKDESVLDLAEASIALVSARYLTEDGDIGERLDEVVALRKEAYAPSLASEGITRRFGYIESFKDKDISPLTREAIHALEATQFTVDQTSLSWALQVQALMGGHDKDDEGYVLKGCQVMIAGAPYVSEFKGDTRVRLYQACFHGPNGQSSDRSRALMDLHGVPTDYDIDIVKANIKAEVMDMVSVSSKEVGALMGRAAREPVAFIVEMLKKKAAKKLDDSVVCEVNKAWSFAKASLIWIELNKGNRPYIGMAVGLDAKCSGPQLGALMVGDQRIAAACGMTLVEMDDAYKLAEHELVRAGFLGLTREDIKKPYMGIFYGQGWMAFTNPADVSPNLWACLYGTGPASDDVAKSFHKAVRASFGTKMNTVRELIKAYGKKSAGRTTHYMPDGALVAMNYKVQVNVLGEQMDWDTAKYDVSARFNSESFKFINFTLNTRMTHEGDFARNGFVNMIQATDALIARLIIVHLERLGAQHIIAVHDCFRVNVTEMHLLKQAIKNAYMDLFGNGKNVPTTDMPLGTDILGLYFQGANDQLIDQADAVMVKQFSDKGTRYMQKINGTYTKNLIAQLATKGEGAYYFDK